VLLRSGSPALRPGFFLSAPAARALRPMNAAVDGALRIGSILEWNAIYGQVCLE
jgi:hypothetical protein